MFVLSISAPDSHEKIVRGPLGGKSTPQKVKNECILTSEDAVGMFLRLQQSIHLKMQNAHHKHATGSHSATTESFSISIDAFSYYTRTLQALSTAGSRSRLVERKNRGGIERASGCIRLRGAGNSGPKGGVDPANVHNRKSEEENP